MPKPPSDNVRINMMISPKLLEKARRLAKKRGTTYTALITTALREHLVVEMAKDKVVGA